MKSAIQGLIARDKLTVQQTNEMFALLSSHFEGVTRSQFDYDLAEKNWVIEIRQAERLVGFSTLLFCEKHFEGNDLTVIYSGDTIMAPEAWNKPTLARTWIAAVNHLRNSSPSRPCYWLLLTSGFRTYRFLPVFWKEFFPRFDSSIPQHIQRLLDFLANEQYGKMYDPTLRIVRFPHPQKLRSQVLDGRSSDSHVAYFLARNPNHSEGDELACLTEICETNLTPAGVRMIRPQR